MHYEWEGTPFKQKKYTWIWMTASSATIALPDSFSYKDTFIISEPRTLDHAEVQGVVKLSSRVISSPCRIQGSDPDCPVRHFPPQHHARTAAQPAPSRTLPFLENEGMLPMQPVIQKFHIHPLVCWMEPTVSEDQGRLRTCIKCRVQLLFSS